MFDATAIRDAWLCNDILCKNVTKHCVIDPENGQKLPLLESDIIFWAKQRSENPEISVDTMPDLILTRLRQKLSNSVAQRKKTEPARDQAPQAPNMTFNFPPWMAGIAGMGFPTTPSMPSIAGSSSSVAPAPGSSPPRENEEAASVFCDFLAQRNNVRVAARLIEVGEALDEEFLDALHIHRLVREDKARLRSLKVEEGIIEKLASRSQWREFISRN